MSAKPFASSADLEEKTATLENLAEGVYAYTAQGDPNVGCVIGTDSVLAIEARATPVMAQRWIDVVRTLTDLPFGDLVLTHYHAVRVLGAAAFDARRIITTSATEALIAERGAEDWASEHGRMPRLFQGAESIPGLTHPTLTFEESLALDLGNREVELHFLGRGHTTGDLGRSGVIVAVLGDPGHEHYRVRWEDERETIVYPGSDVVVRHGSGT